MLYRVHIPGGVPYFSFVVEYDPYTEELDKTITVVEALEWAETVKKALGLTGDSALVDAAVMYGAKPLPPSVSNPPAPTQPQQRQPANTVSASGYWCDVCHGPASEPKMQAARGNRDGTKSAPVDCLNGCENQNNPRFAKSTWVVVG